MTGPTRKLLRLLIDKEWHVYNKLPKGIGVDTVQLCIEQGLLRTKKVNRRVKNLIETHHIAIRITKYGESELYRLRFFRRHYNVGGGKFREKAACGNRLASYFAQKRTKEVTCWNCQRYVREFGIKQKISATTQ